MLLRSSADSERKSGCDGGSRRGCCDVEECMRHVEFIGKDDDDDDDDDDAEGEVSVSKLPLRTWLFAGPAV
jgi:hypothetical protein